MGTTNRIEKSMKPGQEDFCLFVAAVSISAREISPSQLKAELHAVPLSARAIPELRRGAQLDSLALFSPTQD